MKKVILLALSIAVATISTALTINNSVNQVKVLKPNKVNVSVKYQTNGDNRLITENKLKAQETKFISDLKSHNVDFTKTNSSINTYNSNPYLDKGVQIEFYTPKNIKKETLLDKLKNYDITNFYQNDKYYYFTLTVNGDNLSLVDINILKLGLELNKSINNLYVNKYDVIKEIDLLSATYNSSISFEVTIDESALTNFTNMASNNKFTILNVKEINTELNAHQSDLYTNMISNARTQASYIAGLFGENIKAVSLVSEDYNQSISDDIIRPIMTRPMEAKMAISKELEPNIEVKGKDIRLEKTLYLEFTTNRNVSKYTNKINLNESYTTTLNPNKAKITFSINTTADNLRTANGDNSTKLEQVKALLTDLNVKVDSSNLKQTDYRNSSYLSKMKVGEVYNSTTTASLKNININDYYTITAYLNKNNINYNFSNGIIEVSLTAKDSNKATANELSKGLVDKLNKETGKKFNIESYNVFLENIYSDKEVTMYDVKNTLELTTTQLDKVGEIVELIKVLNLNVNSNIEYLFDNNSSNKEIYSYLVNEVEVRKEAIRKAIGVNKVYPQNINISGDNQFDNMYKYVNTNYSKYSNVDLNNNEYIKKLVLANAQTIAVPSKTINANIEITYTY